MDPLNPLKHRISQIFRSCKSRDVPSDVVEHPVSTRQHYQLMDLFSPKPHRPVFSICGPKISESKKSFARREAWNEYEEERPRERKHSRKKKSKRAAGDKKGKKREIKKDNTTQWQANISNNNYYDWSTSDDDVDTDEDDDKTTLFSSKSLTSDSSFSYSSRRSIPIKQEGDDSTATKEGFAVVKRSSDPHSDFRTSMVEMIVEKQIFGAKELEGLLNTFLSLNSCHHHRVIIEVFTEIWEALFSDWS